MEGDAYDVVVVGAGVAGSALAFALGSDGRRVACIERDLSEPNRIVGELLQPGGFLRLKQLGLEQAVEGIDSQRISGYAIFMQESPAVVEYPVKHVDAPQAEGEELQRILREASASASASASSSALEGPGDGVGDEAFRIPADKLVQGRSFHHGRFIRRLRELAGAQANVTMIEGTVNALLEEGGEDGVRGGAARGGGQGGEKAVVGVGYKNSKTGESRQAWAKLTVICDGYASRFRSQVNPAASYDVTSHFVGYVLKTSELPHGRKGHVILAEPSPVLFYPISSTEVRCLVDIQGPMPNKSDGSLARHMRENVAPQLPEVLRAPFLASVDEGGARSMPNKQMPAKPVFRKGCLLLGDAFNMRHPLTGGGMTVALSDVRLIQTLLRSVPDLEDKARMGGMQRVFYAARKSHSSAINTLAGALYEVFCTREGDEPHAIMRQACFDYLALGGDASAGPVGLLSGLDARPHVLIYHFFAVAVFGVTRLLRRGWIHLPSSILTAFLLLLGAVRIIAPIVLREGTRAFLPWPKSVAY